MRYDELPRDDHVCRQIGFRYLIIDDCDNIIGFSYPGLQDTLQPDYDGLSVTWVEYFSGAWDDQVRLAFQAICKTRKPGKRGILAWANVGRIIDESLKSGHRVRILHDPIDKNPAHSLVKHLPQEDINLLDILATEVFGDFVVNSALL